METSVGATTVSAGDIARLVDVGRAAVSNWRRRHDDFPQPVGGTASSPLFSLREVQDWLRANGKTFQLSLADQVWQHLRAADDDLRLGQSVSRAGELLVNLRDGVPTDRAEDPELVRLLGELAAERGNRDAFEFLCARYREAHSRQLAVTPTEIAELMVRLADPAGGTVLDPACGLGTLLLAGRPGRALGQDVDPVGASIAASRLRLHELRTTVVAADSLREDGFPDVLADAVVCEPPFTERSWGYPELTGDARWAYGLPPRGESELAWVQHCLAHVRPGGLVAILMPVAAAGRRPGKRIRGNLLRSGALRAVIGLAAAGPDLWLLRRPTTGERTPTSILLFDAENRLSTVEQIWRGQQDDPHAENSEHTVRIIDLLDDEVDISVAANTARRAGRSVGVEFQAALQQFLSTGPAVPGLTVLPEPHAVPVTTVGELARAGLISIEHEPGSPLLPGDVVAARVGAATVVTESGSTLEPQLTRYRVDHERVDPGFLAGVLRFGTSRATGGSSRIDARRTQLPLLPLAEQRAYGTAIAQLTALAESARAAAELADRLARLGFDGLMDGQLIPGS
ncbi:MAG TPA: N-6 DNA methylase [Pseudonocardiaceae bacterium]|jgi:hypothetical protein|nr:N-6 DNA methylase [Pseudonocardiaceae bacterium]